MCKRASRYITTDHWRRGHLFEAHGQFWGIVGGTSKSGVIVRALGDKTRLEQISIRECETKTFSSGHKVYLTNSNGTSCYITVSPPALAITPPSVDTEPEPIQMQTQPTIPTIPEPVIEEKPENLIEKVITPIIGVTEKIVEPVNNITEKTTSTMKQKTNIVLGLIVLFVGYLMIKRK